MDLFIGSEGTRRVVIEATMRSLPAPETVLGGVVLPSIHGARPLRQRHPDIPAEAAAAILIEQELASEDDPALDAWIERIEASGALAEASWFATTAADRERFRKFRHNLPNWSTTPSAAPAR